MWGAETVYQFPERLAVLLGVCLYSVHCKATPLHFHHSHSLPDYMCSVILLRNEVDSLLIS